jgi:lipoate-protein ligase A
MRAVPNRSERTVARFIYEDMFPYGAPVEVVTDRKKKFMGKVYVITNDSCSQNISLLHHITRELTALSRS